MSTLIIVNVNPVTLSTSIDPQGQLQVSYGSIALQGHDDAVEVRLASNSAGEPLTAKVEISDPGEETQLEVIHEDDSGNPVTWDRIRASSACVHTWHETNHQYAVVVKPSAGQAKPKTIYIEVKPVEDLPDRT
jgi:hypothetical protein